MLNQEQRQLIKRFLDVFLRRKILIIFCLLAAVVIGLGYYLKAPKVYRSSSLIMYQQSLRIEPTRWDASLAQGCPPGGSSATFARRVWQTLPFTGPRRTTLTSEPARPAAPCGTVCYAEIMAAVYCPWSLSMGRTRQRCGCGSHRRRV